MLCMLIVDNTENRKEKDSPIIPPHPDRSIANTFDTYFQYFEVTWIYLTCHFFISWNLFPAFPLALICAYSHVT